MTERSADAKARVAAAASRSEWGTIGFGLVALVAFQWRRAIEGSLERLHRLGGESATIDDLVGGKAAAAHRAGARSGSSGRCRGAGDA